VLAINRFKIKLGKAAHFETQIKAALAAFSACDGFQNGEIGQNLDDPTLWALMTQWKNVGSYRRALSSTRIKMEVVPLLAQAIDEPGAYEKPYAE